MLKQYFIKRKKAFFYAGRGIFKLFMQEAHAKIHLAAAILVVIFGFLFNVSASEWCILLICIGGVFMSEGFNTAIEKLCDKVSPEYNILIETAKDVAAGSVLLFVMASIAIGLIIFLPKLF